MTERIVVSFWMPYAGLSPVTGRAFLERARALTQRGEALGATLIAFGSQICAFAFDPESLEEAVGLATALIDEAQPGEIAWACGIAQGTIEAFLPQDMRGGLAWGPSLAAGAALARIAEPGQILVDRSLRGVGEIVTVGGRVRRDGARRVRGVVLDAKQPWRSVAALQVARVLTPPLGGRENPSALLSAPGALAIVRADPGMGGTRLLDELARAVAPAPSLIVTPSGAGLEPLGALRRALARARVAEASHLEPELDPALHRLLAGDGVPLDTAAAILASYLRPGDGAASVGALLIDDASDVDASSLEVCARALAGGERSFPCIVRLDASSPAPGAFSSLPKGPEIELRPLDDPGAAALANAAVGGGFDEDARRRWARRGANSPLGIMEAIAVSFSSGELAWSDRGVSMRRRWAGYGRPRPAREWIARRARLLSSPVEELILAIVALLGGESHVERLDRVLAAVKVLAQARDASEKLVARRWLVVEEPDWYALPTRSHRDAILGELTDELLRATIHQAIAETFEHEERGLGLSDVAHHLARAGEKPRAARVALNVARAAAMLDLQQATTQLLTFARAQDPSVDEEARAQLASALPMRPSARPPPPDAPPSAPAYGREEEDIPITVAVGPDADDPSSVTFVLASPVEERAPVSEPGTIIALPPTLMIGPNGDGDAGMDEEPATSANVGERLTELAKEALMEADTRALERWTEGLAASGDHGRFADRMQAIVHLSRGDVGEALRVLRSARAELEVDASSAELCQAALALGVALAVAGRPDEALLEALDALARARESGDDKGACACVSFLAKLYASAERPVDAGRLRDFARSLEEIAGPFDA